MTEKIEIQPIAAQKTLVIPCAIVYGCSMGGSVVLRMLATREGVRIMKSVAIDFAD